MDIVQYLHGLVSHPLGISNEDVSADLLKQYYALSVIHIAEHNIDIKDKKNHSILNVWEKQTLPLAKRLARSFHMDEMQTLTLLRTVTPPMMVELNGVVGNLGLSEFLTQHFHRSRTHLPAWSSQFIRADFINLDEIIEVEETPFTEPSPEPAQDSDNPIEPTPHTKNHTEPAPKTTKKTAKPVNKPLWIAGGVVSALAVIGVGIWLALSPTANDTVTLEPNIATPNIQPLSVPRVSITSGDNHTLYACQAEVGNEDLHNQLMQILQKNFGQVSCIIDINSNFGVSLAGLERLESIIAMLKAEPFSSIEIVGDEIVVNTPNSQVLTRLVNDIALLAPQFKVSAMPPLDIGVATNQSLEKATHALNALGNPPDVYDLARAMSLQVLDFNGTDQVPAQNHAVLALSAKKLAQNPNAKLLIISHTDNNGTDRATSVSLAQNQAEAVRAFLIQNGVSDTQLVAKGVGDAFPIADNVTAVGKFKNRRTEFLVYDESILQALSDNLIPATMPQDMTNVVASGGMPNNDATPVYVPPMGSEAVMPTGNAITPMPVQGMPNAQTYAPPPQPTQLASPYPNEVVYNAPAIMSEVAPPAITITSGSSLPSSPSSPSSATTSVVSDELWELSKPVHVETGKGISHEIIAE
ncbi:OmpA family protein [Moraxella oblonga]|uniref:OmpA family protein n=1 Tax=Moraxella oblonga TaxID=200413 RepID=UPI00082E4096|nr:OmpA family protein [Moraxella oblonga]